MKSADLALLGVDVLVTPDELRTQYRALAEQHHPDHGGDAAKFQQLASAYKRLRAEVAKPLKCPTCKGTRREAKANGFHVTKVPCANCRGTGVVERGRVEHVALDPEIGVVVARSQAIVIASLLGSAAERDLSPTERDGARDAAAMLKSLL